MERCNIVFNNIEVGYTATQGRNIMLLYVYPPYRLRGFGSRLLTKAGDAIRKQGYDKAYVHVQPFEHECRQDDTDWPATVLVGGDARAFYYANGYRQYTFWEQLINLTFGDHYLIKSLK